MLLTAILGVLALVPGLVSAQWTKAGKMVRIDAATCSGQDVETYLDQTRTLVEWCQRSYDERNFDQEAGTRMAHRASIVSSPAGNEPHTRESNHHNTAAVSASRPKKPCAFYSRSKLTQCSGLGTVAGHGELPRTSRHDVYVLTRRHDRGSADVVSLDALEEPEKERLRTARKRVKELETFLRSPGYEKPFTGSEPILKEDEVQWLEDHPSSQDEERRGFVVACQRDEAFTKVRNPATLKAGVPTVYTILGYSQCSFSHCVPALT